MGLKVQRLKTFDIDEIANTGNYSFLYSTSLKNVTCSSGDIHGDSLMAYKAVAYNYNNDGQVAKTSYTLRVLGEGILDETLIYTNPISKSTTVFRFKIVVLNWNAELGVFYYTRCSDFGKSDADSRTIVVSACSANNEDAQELASSWAEGDLKAGFKGPALSELPQCSCFFRFK
uniref:Uncharacterized protein n=1 Tax=Clastoptera arizonana TaxID=38151 RepID=A0A1B6CGN5_9HEMI